MTTKKRLLVLILLVAPGTGLACLSAVPDRVVSYPASAAQTWRLHGRIYFMDERLHSSDTDGSRLRSVSNQVQLPYVQYRVRARCLFRCPGWWWRWCMWANVSDWKTASVYARYDHTFSAPVRCDVPMSYQLEVRFQSQIDNTAFHEVTTGTAPISIRQASITEKKGWYSAEGQTTWQSVNVSCPHDYHHYCEGVGSADFDQATHAAANLYRTVYDVGERWGFDYRGQASSVGTIQVQWPHAKGNTTSGYDQVWIRQDSYNSNHRVAHECGHLYHKRALGIRDAGLGAALATGGDTNPANGVADWMEGGHFWHDSGDSEAVAASEGWANFFAAATYFDSDAAAPFYRWCDHLNDPDCRGELFGGASAMAMLEGDTWKYLGGGGTAECVAEGDRKPGDGANDFQVEGNSARFFWDVFDQTDGSDDHDGFTDSQSVSQAEMLEIWEDFSRGAAAIDDHGYAEPRCKPPSVGSCTSEGWDSDDKHGRNVRDYRIVARDRHSPSRNFYDLYRLNCLRYQDED